MEKFTDEEIDSFTVKKLKEELKKRDINVKGCTRKAQFQAKLKEHFANLQSETTETEVQIGEPPRKKVKYLSDDEPENAEEPSQEIATSQPEKITGERPQAMNTSYAQDAQPIDGESSSPSAAQVEGKSSQQNITENIEAEGESSITEKSQMQIEKSDQEALKSDGTTRNVGEGETSEMDVESDEESESEEELVEELFDADDLPIFKPLTEMTFDSSDPEEEMVEEPVAREAPKPKKKKKKRKKIKLVFRNYIPKSDKLKKYIKAPAQPINNFDGDFEELMKAAVDPNIEFDLTPKKIDWDLKRDVEKDLKKLETQTMQAIQKILDERESSSEDESGSDSSGDDDDSSSS